MAKTFSSISEQFFIQELRHQLIAKIATVWENEWNKKVHGDVFSSIKDLPSQNAFYIDLKSKICKFLEENSTREGSKIDSSQFPTEHTLRRFLDENNEKGFDIDITLNPIAQYCGYENWENFKTLNTEEPKIDYPLSILQRGGGLEKPFIFIHIPQKSRNWKRIVIIVIFLISLLSGLYYYFYRYLPFRTLTPEEIQDFQISLDHSESDHGRNPYKAFFKYDFSKLRLDSLNVNFGGNRGITENINITLKQPKGEFSFDFYKAGVHKVFIKHQNQLLKTLPVYVKSHGWSCYYHYLTLGKEWVNTNAKYQDFYVDGYLHLPRLKVMPSHQENYTINISRAEDYRISMDSCTIEFKQKNSPDEEGISFYFLDTQIRNEIGQNFSLIFQRNRGKLFFPNKPAEVYKHINDQIYRQLFEIPMICYDWTTVKLSIKHNKAQLWINGKLWTTSTIIPLSGQLKEIHLESKGSGKWDDFRVSNSYTGKVVFEDNFNVIPVSRDGY